MDGERIAISFASTKEATCQTCGDKFVYEPILFRDREFVPRKFCESCSSTQERARAEEYERINRDAAAAKVAMAWAELCPPLYRETDSTRISPECIFAVNKWEPVNALGLGLIGMTGTGKTRSLYLALRKAFDAKKSCDSITHNAFSKLAQAAFMGKEREPSVARLSRLQTCAVLLLDDLGKPPATERADAELEELIEIRTSHYLPILWSANGSSEWLQKRLGPDRGPALVRRLSEFSTVITL